MSLSLLGALQIIVSLTLIVLILLQQRGGGLGAIGGLNTPFYGTRRGLEKTVFIFTIILVIVFIALAVLSFVI